MAPWTNRDVNLLLNRLENHPGVTILATNLGRILDRALDRRVDVAVEFGLPDTGMRRELYRRLVPRGAPVAKDVGFEWVPPGGAPGRGGGGQRRLGSARRPIWPASRGGRGSAGTPEAVPGRRSPARSARLRRP